jgi:glycosyltransferase involved in cell wall biosynthesis
LARHQRELDVALATHEGAAIPALLLKRLGLLRIPVIVLTVAATADRQTRGVRARLFRWALGAADIVTVYASNQAPLLMAMLGGPAGLVRFVPFGADDGFFRPRETPRDRSVLSVGTNEGKDFPTLLSALPEDVPCTIVTDAPNVAVCREHGYGDNVTLRQAVPITVLRDMYAAAGVVVFPLHEATFSSGQTVMLENALMGSPMIVSDVSGARDYVPEAVRVPPGDPHAMAAAIERALRLEQPTMTYDDVPTARDLARTLSDLIDEVTAQ